MGRNQRTFVSSFSGESPNDQQQGCLCAVGDPHTARSGSPDNGVRRSARRLKFGIRGRGHSRHTCRQSNERLALSL
jgi:hypothetical protein